MRRKPILGLLAIFAGVFFLLPMLFGGARGRMQARSEFMQARYEAMQAEQAETADSAESATNSEFSHRGRHAHRHHHGFGLFGFIFKLLLLGFLFKMVARKFRHRRHHRHGRHPKGESADDLTGDIRVGDEINRAEASAESASVDPEEMTVEDLLLAMKRLGIKKLEL